MLHCALAALITLGVPSTAMNTGSSTDVAKTPPVSTASATAATKAPSRPSTERVGGDRKATARLDGETWRSGKLFIRSPLPVGYPPPTPARAIEIKRYPSVRRAEISGQGDARRASGRGFYPLFNHIQSNDIAMTAPVEMDLPGWSGAPGAEPERWTMSFLYRVPELRETGQDGDVKVVDTRPLTVVSIGTQGEYGVESMRGALKALEGWLAEQNEWEVAGPPRWLAYNGPYVPRALRWGEVQIPVERVATAGSADVAEPAR